VETGPTWGHRDRFATVREADRRCCWSCSWSAARLLLQGSASEAYPRPRFDGLGWGSGGVRVGRYSVVVLRWDGRGMLASGWSYRGPPALAWSLNRQSHPAGSALHPTAAQRDSVTPGNKLVSIEDTPLSANRRASLA
jgi:hypothetical protein